MAQSAAICEVDENECLDFKTHSSATYHQKIGCGDLYVTIIYKKDGEIGQVLIETDGARNNDCGKSAVESIADLVTFALRRRSKDKRDARLIIKALSHHYCNKKYPGRALSCSDAVARVLTQVLEEELND